jgi:DNA polymerase-4
MDATLSHLCQKAMKRLREAGLSASTVTLTIRYSGFETITRAHTLREPTHLDPIVFETLKKLFERHCDRARKVRLLGVALSSFTHGGEQLDLLDAARREKLERLAQATDALRDRFGFSKVQFGGSVTKEKRPNEE